MGLFNKFANWLEEQERQQRIEKEKQLHRALDELADEWANDEEWQRVDKELDEEIELLHMMEFLIDECILIGYLEEEERSLQYCEKLLIENNLVYDYFDWKRDLVIEEYGEDCDLLDEIDEQEEAMLRKIRH